MKIMQGKLGIMNDQAQNLASLVSFRTRMLYNPTKSFMNFLNPGFGVAIVQTCIVLMAATAVKRKELLIKSIINRFGSIISQIACYSILGTISFLSSILIQTKLFKIPFRGSLFDAFVLSILMSAAISSFAILISSIFENKTMAITANAVLFIPSTILAGYTWPAMSMPIPYKIFAELLPFFHYADNIRDLYSKAKPLHEMFSDIAWLFTFFVTCIAITLFCLTFMKVPRNTESNPQLCIQEGDHL